MEQERLPNYRDWHCFKAGELLRSSVLLSDADKKEKYERLIEDVIAILFSWGEQWAGYPQWRSFLDKRSLLHELEESVVALQFLIEWLEEHDGSRVSVVDICCGKGILSMLLSYLVSIRPSLRGRISGIILVEKSLKIDWRHIEAANAQLSGALGESSLVPAIQLKLMAGCNVFDDSFEDVLRGSPDPVVLVGIHLCRGLSPRCISLFNMLGPAAAPFLLLAPCCVPQAHVKQIEVAIFEGDSERAARLEANAKRDRVVAPTMCRFCYDRGHVVAECPGLPRELAPEERTRLIQDATTRAPCWRCGEFGHQKSACKASQATARPKRLPRPSVTLNMSAVHAGRRQKIVSACDDQDDPVRPILKARNRNGRRGTPEVKGEGKEGEEGEEEEEEGRGEGQPPFDAWVETLCDVVEAPQKEVAVVPIDGQFAGCHDARDWAGYRKCSWLLARR